MTISTTTTKIIYSPGGTETDFTVPFVFFDAADLEVIERVITTGDETSKTLNTDYTVTGGNGASGTVRAVAPPPATVQWVIRRRTPLTQEIDYVENDPFPAATHEEGLDRAVMRLQERTEELDRSLKFPVSDAESLEADIPNSVSRASKVLAFDASGIPMVSAKDLSALETEADAAAASAAAAAASAGSAATSESNAAASAATAANSESNAGVSESNAAAAAADADTAAQALAEKYVFDGSLSMADPGAGGLRLNNATLAGVTQIAVSAQTAGTGNPDVSAAIATWDDSTNSTLRGTLMLRKAGAPSTFATFSITGAITDNGAWLQIPVTYVAGSGTWSAADTLYLGFSRTGDAGAVTTETGTWTPTLGFATPGDENIVLSVAFGSYTRIGDLVTVFFNIGTSTFTHSTASGNVQIGSLPFSSADITNQYSRGPIAWAGINKSGYSQISSILSPNSSTIELKASGNGLGISDVSTSDMPSGGSVIVAGSMSYKI